MHFQIPPVQDRLLDDLFTLNHTDFLSAFCPSISYAEDSRAFVSSGGFYDNAFHVMDPLASTQPILFSITSRDRHRFVFFLLGRCFLGIVFRIIRQKSYRPARVGATLGCISWATFSGILDTSNALSITYSKTA